MLAYLRKGEAAQRELMRRCGYRRNRSCRPVSLPSRGVAYRVVVPVDGIPTEGSLPVASGRGLSYREGHPVAWLATEGTEVYRGRDTVPREPRGTERYLPRGPRDTEGYRPRCTEGYRGGDATEIRGNGNPVPRNADYQIRCRDLGMVPGARGVGEVWNNGCGEVWRPPWGSVCTVLYGMGSRFGMGSDGNKRPHGRYKKTTGGDNQIIKMTTHQMTIRGPRERGSRCCNWQCISIVQCRKRGGVYIIILIMV